MAEHGGGHGGGGGGIGWFEYSVLIIFGFLVLYFFYSSIFTGDFVDVFILGIYKFFLSYILPVVGVIILGRMTWRLWLHYVQQDFISGIDFTMLEIIPPREVLRSPKAMELFMTNALYHWSNKGGREEYWQGAVWFWFSLEIASIEGQVHFYIRTPSRLKDFIETQMYAQYPQAQVKVVEDYTMAVDEISERSAWQGWGCEFDLVKHWAFPIKTYTTYGLDKDPKEEYKVDPISPVIEFFGSMGKGEQAWLQIVVTPIKKQWHTHGTWFGHHDWVHESEVQMKKFLRPYTSTRESADEPGHYGTEIRVPTHLDSVVKELSRKTTKLGFETGIRVMYIAKKENWNITNRRAIRLIFRQYEQPDSNGFLRVNSTQGDAFNSQWFGLSPKKVMILADRMLLEYRERNFFHPPLRHHFYNSHNMSGLKGVIAKQFVLPYFHPPTYVLNVEELATLWHFPGQVLKVPTLERIESKEASPPTNLPI